MTLKANSQAPQPQPQPPPSPPPISFLVAGSALHNGAQQRLTFEPISVAVLSIDNPPAGWNINTTQLQAKNVTDFWDTHQQDLVPNPISLSDRLYYLSHNNFIPDGPSSNLAFLIASCLYAYQKRSHFFKIIKKWPIGNDIKIYATASINDNQIGPVNYIVDKINTIQDWNRKKIIFFHLDLATNDLIKTLAERDLNCNFDVNQKHQLLEFGGWMHKCKIKKSIKSQTMTTVILLRSNQALSLMEWLGVKKCNCLFSFFIFAVAIAIASILLIPIPIIIEDDPKPIPIGPEIQNDKNIEITQYISESKDKIQRLRRFDSTPEDTYKDLLNIEIKSKEFIKDTGMTSYQKKDLEEIIADAIYYQLFSIYLKLVECSKQKKPCKETENIKQTIEKYRDFTSNSSFVEANHQISAKMDILIINIFVRFETYEVKKLTNLIEKFKTNHGCSGYIQIAYLWEALINNENENLRISLEKITQNYPKIPNCKSKKDPIFLPMPEVNIITNNGSSTIDAMELICAIHEKLKVNSEQIETKCPPIIPNVAIKISENLVDNLKNREKGDPWVMPSTNQ